MIAPEIVTHMTASQLGVSVMSLTSADRSAHLARGRRLAWHLSTRHCDLSISALARTWNRDHTTLLHGLRRVADDMTDPEFRLMAEELDRRLANLGDDAPRLDAEADEPAEDIRDLVLDLCGAIAGGEIERRALRDKIMVLSLRLSALEPAVSAVLLSRKRLMATRDTRREERAEADFWQAMKTLQTTFERTRA
jgi:Bacterial dnaA protein helix-turn-helix